MCYERRNMKALTKSLIVASLVGAVGAGGIATATIANAESGGGSSDPASSLVEKIASKFNLDKTKVQALFDEERQTREAEHDKQRAERLQLLVNAGTITSSQKTAIEAKIAEIKKEREADKDAMKNLSDDERKAKMDAKRSALEEWAKTQGLDLAKLQGVFGGGRGEPRKG